MSKTEREIGATFLILLVLVVLGAASCGKPKAEAAPPVQNLRAMAKLYGYLRYFNPSDEAARVDWDGLAVHAAAQVKDAADPATLEAALEEVFRPVAPAMVLYRKGETPPASAAKMDTPEEVSKLVSWQHVGVGSAAGGSLYKSVRLNRPYEADGRATVGAQGIDVTKYAGKTIRMKAWVKVRGRGPRSQAQLWLRVDRGSEMGFFDNMSDRPIRADEWTEYAIEGPIAEDANRIGFGALASGKGEFLYDDFRIWAVDAEGREAPLAFPNGGFEVEGSATAGAMPPFWGAQVQGMEFQVREGDAREGRRAFEFSTKEQPFAPPLFDKRAPAGAVIDREIGRGLAVRFPLTLEMDETGTLPHGDAAALERLRAAVDAASGSSLTGASESVRLADVVIAWNVFQHFYPYFDVVEVDWDAVLTRSLERALTDKTEEDLLRTLSWLVARLDDGHGGVYHASQRKLGRPPFTVERIEDRAVVLASRDPAFKRGDVILALDGKASRDILREEEDYLSGSPQWKRCRSAVQFGLGPVGSRSEAKVRRGRETLETPFTRTADPPAAATPAHAPIDTLEDGILYVDLGRAPWTAIEARIKDLAAAEGVVFDLRGYPNGNHQVLSHLLREPDRDSAWMKVPLIVLPDREGWTFREMGWNLPVAEPRIGGRVVFLTDGRAISYAESFMSFVEHYKLGEIVGEPTAGANGNVNPFTLPGGYNVSWTGMKVVKHDGSQHHTIGIQPTVPCRRTVAGVAAGRDEQLEKALEIIRAKGVRSLS
jgi:C-terminal processing protease CtpA/Prc